MTGNRALEKRPARLRALGSYDSAITAHRKTGAIFCSSAYSSSSTSRSTKGIFGAIKNAFEDPSKANNHTLALKRIEPTPPAKPPTSLANKQ